MADYSVKRHHLLFRCVLIRLCGFLVDLAGALRTKPRAFLVSPFHPTCNQRKREVAFVCPAIKPRPFRPLAMRRAVTREFQRFARTSDSENLVSHWRRLPQCEARQQPAIRQ